MHKEQAQERSDRIRAFQAELKMLERENMLILSEDQRRVLAEYHDKLLLTASRAFSILKSNEKHGLTGKSDSGIFPKYTR